MQNGEVVSVGTVSDRRCLIELKTWLEGARDMLIPAVRKAEYELQRMRRLEAEYAMTEAPFPVTERLIDIRAGIEECLEVLRDQDREWMKRINSVENLSGWEASGEVSDGRYITEFRTWLEGAHEMLIPAIQRAENELERIRRTESAFSATEALFPLAEKLAGIRAGMDECLEILHDQNIEWISRVTWIENLKETTAVWQVSGENIVEAQAEASSKSPISDCGVAPFHYDDQASIDKRNSTTAAPTKAFSERSHLTFTVLVFATLLVAASLSYLIANQSSRISDLHQYIHTLKKELSTKDSVNKDLTLKNADLSKYIDDVENSDNTLKNKNNELALALKAEHSSLVQSKHDQNMIQSTSLRIISGVKSQLIDIARTQTELKGSLYLSEISKAKPGRSLILSPVWFTSGESAPILNGKFTIRIEQASGQNSRPDVIVQLSSARPGFARHPFNKIFRPRLMVPENFRLKHHRCSLVLLGSKANDDGTKAYLIAVLKK